MKKFEVIEDNSGGLHLVVFNESSSVEHFNSGNIQKDN